MMPCRCGRRTPTGTFRQQRLGIVKHLAIGSMPSSGYQRPEMMDASLRGLHGLIAIAELSAHLRQREIGFSNRRAGTRASGGFRALDELIGVFQRAGSVTGE